MLRTLGFLFLVVIVAAGIAAGIWYHQDRQARQFVIAVTPLIYSDWNVEALTRRSARVLQSPDLQAQARDLFKMFSPHLGPLESAKAPEGALQYGQLDREMRRGLFGKYTSSAKFRGGEAELEFVVIKEQGAWRIAGFRVTSPTVAEAWQKRPPAQGSEPTFVNGPPDEEQAVLAEAEEILRLMDSEDPGASWNRASRVFHEATPKSRFVAGLKNLREKTGHLQNRKLQGVGFMFDRPGAKPPGDYAVADFVSTYSHATLQERLGFYKVEGKWLFSAHKWTRMDDQQK